METLITRADLLARLAKKRDPLIQINDSILDKTSHASVLVPIIDNEELLVLFTERTAHLRNHAGQISFPGGRWELNDNSLADTCLRETAEEIGITADQINIITHIPSAISSSGFTVVPFVGLVNPDYSLKIDPFEVASVFTVPLNYLLDPINQQKQQYLYQGKQRDIYVIQYKKYRIWGLTAKIIVDLTAELFNSARPV